MGVFRLAINTGVVIDPLGRPKVMKSGFRCVVGDLEVMLPWASCSFDEVPEKRKVRLFALVCHAGQPRTVHPALFKRPLCQVSPSPERLVQVCRPQYHMLQSAADLLRIQRLLAHH
jgi:hypothetical protein